MKKIAILHRYPPRQVVGTNASFIEFLHELVNNNIETYYVTYKDTVPIENVPGVKFITLPFTFNRGKSSDKVVKTYLWIVLTPIYVLYLNLVKKIDFFYCDDSVPFYGYFAKLLSPKAKVVIRLGDLQTGYALADNHPSLFRIVLKAEAFMWKKVDGVVAMSAAFKDFLRKQHVPDKKISVVEESINLSTEVPSTPRQQTNTTNILFHGALLKCKGVETLLDAFGMLLVDIPNAQLTIAGGGTEESLLKQYVLVNGISNIKFTGWYDHTQLASILSETDISVVMRSTNLANNFVVTTCLLENWAYRVPVLAPDLESFIGIIEDGKNGILFETGNVVDLYNKMKHLATNQGLWKQLGNNGYITAQRHFSHSLIARKMVEALKKY